MSRFLWIEDFENGTQTPTEFLWGNYLPQSFQIPDDSEALVELLDEHGIILKLDFWSGWEFIQKNLKEVDYIILDVDLEIGGKKENLLEILKKYNYKPPYENQEEDKRKYRDALKELKKIAGYQLYLELVFEKSFPKQHILFSTNHLGELNSIREAFSTAKLNLPPL
ncbi:MAG: hypothetical protein SVR94_13450, partial [Pseudomonadota bacterium]|nr:hypothetical protein [Pseudomonadota bacterium]